MAKAHRTHDEATVEMFRRDPNLAAEYLNSVLVDGDETDLMLALRSLSKAFGGVQEIARQAEVNAHTLYRTLSEQGNPELKTLSAILKAMGMRLAVQPIHRKRSAPPRMLTKRAGVKAPHEAAAANRSGC